MADRQKDRPEYQSLKGRNFGPGEDGTSFARNFGQAMSKGLAFGAKKNRALVAFLPAAVIALGTQLGSINYLSRDETNIVNDPAIVQVDPAVGLSAPQDGKSHFFAVGLAVQGHEVGDGTDLANRLLLEVTPAGEYRLYYASGPTHHDSRLVYIQDEETALRLTADMARNLREANQRAAGNLANMPKFVPVPFGYERISEVFQDGSQIYRVGDNFTTRGGGVTREQLAAQAALWTAAAQNFAAGRLNPPASVAEADILPTLSDWFPAWGLMFLGVYGGLAGACAAGAAVSANRKSRRRANGPK